MAEEQLRRQGNNKLSGRNGQDRLMSSTSDRSIEQIAVLVSITIIFCTYAQRLSKIPLTRFLNPSINTQGETVEPSDNNNAFPPNYYYIASLYRSNHQ